jgi:hypothetical protein
MGPSRRDDLLPGWRIDMIGQPEEVQADGDEGLAILEIRSDGIYVKAMGDDKGHRSAEVSILTGDAQGRRKSGLPMLPIPFTTDDLRSVQGGALGIVERLSCGDETNALLAKLVFRDPCAEEVARALMGISEGPEAGGNDRGGEVHAPRLLNRGVLIDEIERDHPALKNKVRNFLGEASKPGYEGLLAAKSGRRGYWDVDMVLNWFRERGHINQANKAELLPDPLEQMRAVVTRR